MKRLHLLGQRAAQELDVELMKSPGFTLDQLMELAGLSVASAVASEWKEESRILVICGPGNNGGDGLVASRHLFHFGLKPTILYPKPPRDTSSGPGKLYNDLVTQCKDLNIPFWDKLEGPIDAGHFDGVVDAIFGFSFDPSGGIRAPFDTILAKMQQTEVPVASVDIPSGWHVEEGDTLRSGFMPHMLISLTAPKRCAAHFTGPHHYLGGRFLPPGLAQKYNLTTLPKYPGVEQCVRLEEDACRM
mmetsp:Transcript_14484/g.26892  ORF Transcript_14484/g.26892 Transcript_14484/m.26892 type:complete len:245 (+) Transcript_14484:288-1022(+)